MSVQKIILYQDRICVVAVCEFVLRNNLQKKKQNSENYTTIKFITPKFISC